MPKINKSVPYFQRVIQRYFKKSFFRNFTKKVTYQININFLWRLQIQGYFNMSENKVAEITSILNILYPKFVNQ